MEPAYFSAVVAPRAKCWQQQQQQQQFVVLAAMVFLCSFCSLVVAPCPPAFLPGGGYGTCFANLTLMPLTTDAAWCVLWPPSYHQFYCHVFAAAGLTGCTSFVRMRLTAARAVSTAARTGITSPPAPPDQTNGQSSCRYCCRPQISVPT